MEISGIQISTGTLSLSSGNLRAAQAIYEDVASSRKQAAGREAGIREDQKADTVTISPQGRQLAEAGFRTEQQREAADFNRKEQQEEAVFNQEQQRARADFQRQEQQKQTEFNRNQQQDAAGFKQDQRLSEARFQRQQSLNRSPAAKNTES
jgi:hypothetical protein